MLKLASQGRRLRPLLEKQRTAWRVLKFFAETPTNEVAFWRRFAELPREDKKFLGAFNGTPTPWNLFRRICLVWNVRTGRRDDARPGE